jgi:hypothetical protein
MPVVFDNAAQTANQTTNIALTLTLGANAVLLVFAAGRDAPFSASAVAYGGVALSKIADVSQEFEIVTCWALTAPAAGVNTLSVAFSNIARFSVLAASYQNVKASGPFGTIVSGVSALANATFSVSSTSTDVVAACWAGINQHITANNGTTRASVSTTASGVPAVLVDITGAGTVSLSATQANAVAWGFIGVPLRFSAVAATSLRTMCLTGVGS